MGKSNEKRLTVVTVKRGQALSQAMCDAIRAPERLITSRHCRRLADGRLEARREFKVALPAD